MTPTEFLRRCAPAGRPGMLAGVGGLFLLLGCSPKDAATGVDKPDLPRATETSAVVEASGFASVLPHVGGPAGYVGSQACRACHEDQYDSWHRSYHRTMTQIAAADTVRADFHNVALTNDGVRFVLSQQRDEFHVRMERNVATPDGPAAETADVRVGLVTGSHHMQVFWVPSGDGNMQIGFPFTWLIPEKRWVPRNSTFVRPPEVVHQSEVWNVVCSRCHATGTEPRANSETRTMDTRVAELGIACEACHGPGQSHVAARRAARNNPRPPDAQILRNEIVHPKKIDPARSAQICGFCHSMKWFDKSEGWRQSGFRFRPGDDLEQTTPIIRPSRIAAIPGLADVLARDPDLLRDFFWSDGMIRVSGRDYNGLLESPCYKGGRFSCLSCHSLHESDPNGQLARNRTDNRTCTQCHERFKDEPQVAAHTHHPAASSGSQCYNCHMPHTTYGVLKAIRSHQISSPRVADELATGRPNACNLCHLDKTLAWTALELKQWYGQAIPELTNDQTNIADAVRLALAGDAGQRVLLAWHLGWGPALEISRTNWVAPILGQLLDDSYAAVRCVAERSLKQVMPGIVPTGYDYTLPPESRGPVESVVVGRWNREMTAEQNQNPPGQTMVRLNDLTAMKEGIQRLIRQQDQKPVRLRE
ncbi:MAG TPA: multiheme c-type cytochrome [Candidatus Angelobacter sp.]|nr:multiheme c-type cytochrome [Candidatus Angelobacter sp.]